MRRKEGALGVPCLRTALCELTRVHTRPFQGLYKQQIMQYMKQNHGSILILA